MPLPRGNLSIAIFAALAALLAAATGACAAAEDDREQPRLGLLTSLPIFWSESFDIAEIIDGEAPPHWARTALGEDYRLVPLDTLEALDGRANDDVDFLLLAQPRPLSPSENVALMIGCARGGAC